MAEHGKTTDKIAVSSLSLELSMNDIVIIPTVVDAYSTGLNKIPRDVVNAP
jgi:hypothetical protein